jgi:cytochrome c-type biogenesis protein CcmH
MLNYRIVYLLILNFLIFLFNANAGIYPEKYLSDSLERRATNLFSQINCPVCQGQTISDSFVPISKQIRQIVRQKLQAGKSDEEIKIYLIENFGESIIHAVEFKLNNIYLILLPLTLIIFGLYVISRYSRKKRRKHTNQEGAF